MVCQQLFLLESPRRRIVRDRECRVCVVHKVTITPSSLVSLSHFIHESVARETRPMRLNARFSLDLCRNLGVLCFASFD